MGIMDNAKNIAELVKKYNDQELYEKIMSLREQILSLREENIGLKEKIKTMEKAFEIKEKLIKDGNCYFRASDTEKKQPYCMTCWDADKKLVSLMRERGVGGTRIRCNICRKR